MAGTVIHYCWFGRGEKPKLTKKCIESWKKHLPGYEILEWNEDNFDINSVVFVREAYEDRNFAFVSDYVRAWALYNHGGIYMDTDVELLGNYDDFLKYNMFLGFEEGCFAGTCVMGAKPGQPLLKEYMHHYEDITYFNDDNTKYQNTNVVLLTQLLEKHGLKKDDSFQLLEGGIAVFPRTYFSPYDYINGISYITPESVAIHHFAQTWLPKRVRAKTTLKRAIIKLIGAQRFKNLRGR